MEKKRQSNRGRYIKGKNIVNQRKETETEREKVDQNYRGTDERKQEKKESKRKEKSRRQRGKK